MCLSARTRLDLILIRKSVGDDVVHDRSDREPRLGDYRRHRIKRNRMQHELCRQIPRSRYSVFSHHIGAPAPQWKGRDSFTQHFGFDVGGIEADDRRTNLGKASEQPGDIPSDAALPGGRMVDRPSVYE